MDCKFTVGQEVVYTGGTHPAVFHGARLSDEKPPLEVGQVVKITKVFIAPKGVLRGFPVVMIEGFPTTEWAPSLFRPVEKPKLSIEDMLKAPPGPEIEQREFVRRKPHHVKHSAEAYLKTRVDLYSTMRRAEVKIDRETDGEVRW